MEPVPARARTGDGADNVGAEPPQNRTNDVQPPPFDAALSEQQLNKSPTQKDFMEQEEVGEQGASGSVSVSASAEQDKAAEQTANPSVDN